MSTSTNDAPVDDAPAPVSETAASSPAVPTPSRPERNPDPAAIGLRSSDRKFVIALSGAIIILILIHLARMSLKGRPMVEIDRLTNREAVFQIDINKATWVEWTQLPGIGETTARNIVAEREKTGPFQSIEDIDRIPGIGTVTMNKIRPFLKL
ncbi:ComEA family DNA-binding protein [Planctomicrobium sp. SH661]|uniref:ComEA family DNA-binding protein n=1 Tax=Planctomicrobium sp. SH661 TaxID=3448124 RepID=UPI003F5B0BA2